MTVLPVPGDNSLDARRNVLNWKNQLIDSDSRGGALEFTAKNELKFSSYC